METSTYTKQPLTFPIIKKSKKGITLLKSAIVFVVITIMIVVIISKTSLNTNHNVSFTSAILFIAVILITLIINFFAQKYRFGGEFTITDKEIKLRTTNKEATFFIKDLTGFKMSLNQQEYNPDSIHKNITGVKTMVIREGKRYW